MKQIKKKIKKREKRTITEVSLVYLMHTNLQALLKRTVKLGTNGDFISSTSPMLAQEASQPLAGFHGRLSRCSLWTGSCAPATKVKLRSLHGSTARTDRFREVVGMITLLGGSGITPQEKLQNKLHARPDCI